MKNTVKSKKREDLENKKDFSIANFQIQEKHVGDL